MEGKRLQQFTTPRCPVLSSNEVTQIRQNSENDVQGNYGAKTRTPLRGAGHVHTIRTDRLRLINNLCMYPGNHL